MNQRVVNRQHGFRARAIRSEVSLKESSEWSHSLWLLAGRSRSCGNTASTGASDGSSTTGNSRTDGSGVREKRWSVQPKRSGGHLRVEAGESPPSKKARLVNHACESATDGTTSISSSASSPSSALSSSIAPSTFASPSAGSTPISWTYRAIRAWPSVAAGSRCDGRTLQDTSQIPSSSGGFCHGQTSETAGRTVLTLCSKANDRALPQPTGNVRRTAVQEKGPENRAFLGSHWSGRVDLNHRPLGPET